MSEDVEALIERFKCGDERAFERIVELYRKRIASYVADYSVNREDQDDLVEDVTLHLYSGLRNFRGDSTANTFIYSIMHNVCRSFLRTTGRRLKRVTRFADFDDGGENLPNAGMSGIDDLDDALVRTDRGLALARMLRELPEAQREAFMLAEVHGMSYEEIAVLCKIPVETVKTRIHRARKKLQEKILREGELFGRSVNRMI